MTGILAKYFFSQENVRKNLRDKTTRKAVGAITMAGLQQLSNNQVEEICRLLQC